MMMMMMALLVAVIGAPRTATGVLEVVRVATKNGLITSFWWSLWLLHFKLGPERADRIDVSPSARFKVVAQWRHSRSGRALFIRSRLGGVTSGFAPSQVVQSGGAKSKGWLG